MMNFYETYDCKIDDKGRLKLPSSLIKLLQSSDDKNFVIKRSVFQNCLEVYPMQPWEKLMKKINGLNRFVKKNADFIRMFTAGVKNVELDSSERILIPKDLKQYANLNKEIVIAGAGELFEIWDKESYENVITANKEDFGQLTEEVMGEIDFEL
jgi:MraZ protein